MALDPIPEQQNIDIWKARWQALDRVFAVNYDRINSLLAQGRIDNQAVRLDVVKDVLQLLQDFGRQQFHFFYHGFYNPSAGYRFANPVNVQQAFHQYKSDYEVGAFALTTTLEQVTQDLEALSRAIDQRSITAVDSSVPAATLTKSPSNFSRITDLLVIGALMMIDDTFRLKPETTALTYLRRSTSVRMIPYAPVAVIGIPPTSLTVAEDLLAIPHEVGHYLYWNGVAQSNSSFRKRLQTGHRWEEELFADVIGTFIGGPLVALSFQELMERAVGTKFIEDDGLHPIPAIRPYLYLKVLGSSLWPTDMTEITAQLKTRWETVLQERKITSNGTLPQALADELARADEALDKIIQDLMTLGGLDTSQMNLVWSSSTVPLTELYAEFRRNLQEIPDSLINSIQAKMSMGNLLWQPIKFTVERWQTRVRDKIQWENDIPDWLSMVPDDLSTLAIGTSDTSTPATTIPAAEWLALLEFNGWTTEGPGPGHVGPD